MNISEVFMFNKKFIIMIESAILLLILGVFTFSMSDFSMGCDDIYSNMLRLHVIANSDSEKDQKLKLLVRDEILKTGSELFDGKTNIDTAADKLYEEREKLEEAAKSVLRENGCDGDVKISLSKSYFEVRQYEGFTVPAGFYNSVLVEIGNAKGKNWWCVMFPPLCIPAVSDNGNLEVFNEDGKAVLLSDLKIDARFKVAEMYHSARKFIKKITN